MQVDTHTQVEISFGRGAHHRSEVEDTGSAVIDDLGQGRMVRDIPGGHVQPWVSGDGWLWRDGIQHHEGINGLRGATGANKCAAV